MIAVFQKISQEAKLPSKANVTDAGWDVYSTIDATVIPGGRVKIPLGLIWEPKLSKAEKDFIWEIQVRPKSGLALNDGITVLNTPGTIDQNYRDEIAVIIINHSNHDVNIKKGQKVAQFVFDMKPMVDVQEGLIDITKNNRGGGFGHSGIY